jgi:hypothetical protein
MINTSFLLLTEIKKGEINIFPNKLYTNVIIQLLNGFTNFLFEFEQLH